MNKISNTKEKTCAFYVSDYHFEKISLPYIENKVRADKKVFILTENSLQNTIKTLIEHINLSDKKKENILNLDWNNNDEEKYKNIKEDIKNGEDVVIFVKGKTKYIEEANKNIEKINDKNKNIKIIDCYNVDEIAHNMQEIENNYAKILNTSGEKILEK